MNERTDIQWRYRGSAIIFKTKLLATILAAEDAVVAPLHSALTWVGGIPGAVPVAKSGSPAKTILLGGLDPILELMPLKEAEDFLRIRCRRLVSVLQDHWPEVGILFGTNIAPERVRVDHQDHVLLKRDDQTELRLSSSLWNGSAGSDLSELRVSPEARGSTKVEGYYVRRLS